MDLIQVFRCNNWYELKQTIISVLFPEHYFALGRFWFRGHSNSDYTLQSSFDRWFDALCKSGNRNEVSKTLLTYFEEAAVFFPELEEIMREHDATRLEMRKLALAQHHGVPTRLLDWSESLYVAAFFAFAGVPIDQNVQSVSVWAFDTKHTVWNDDSGAAKVSVLKLGNTRMHTQKGCFTLLRSPKRSLEDHLQQFQNSNFNAPALYHFMVPAIYAREALSDLASMNITHSTLFPGLDGCALAAKMQFILDLKIEFQ